VDDNDGGWPDGSQHQWIDTVRERASDVGRGLWREDCVDRRRRRRGHGDLCSDEQQSIQWIGHCSD
jgi:hypothetical protein